MAHVSIMAAKCQRNSQPKKNCWKKCPEWQRTTAIGKTLKEQDYKQGGKE